MVERGYEWCSAGRPWLAAVYCFLLVATPTAAVQSPRFGGAPMVRVWTPEEYSGGEQIFDLAQLPSGELLLADVGDRAVHRYDGAQWRTFPVPGEPLALALGPDPLDGTSRIWVATSRDLGWLEDVGDPARSLRFVSLRSQIPEAYSDIARFDTVEVAEGAVYFGQNTVLLRWDGRQMRGWDPPDGEAFGWPEWVDGRLLVGARKGQFELVGDEFVPRPEMGHQSSKIVSWSEGRWLLFRYQGTPLVELYDPVSRELEPFPGPLDSLLQSGPPQDVVRLPGGLLAVTVPRKGVVVVNDEGEIVQQVGEGSGLQSSEAYRLLLDAEGLLWATLTEGVASVDLAAPIEVFPPGRSLSGFLTDIDWFGGDAVATSFDGVFVFRERDAERGFVAVPELEGVDSWQVLASEERCVVLTDQGPYELFGFERSSGPGVRRLAEGGPLALAATSRSDRLLAVGNQRLQMYDVPIEAGRAWQVRYRIDLPNYADEVVALGAGRFWVIGDGSVTLASFDDLDEPPQLASILPDGDWYGVEQIGGRWTLYGHSGVFVLADGADPLRRENWALDRRFAEIDLDQLNRHPSGYGLESDRDGGVWLASIHGFQRYVWSAEEGRFQPQGAGWKTERLGFAHVDPRDSRSVWFEERGVVARFDGSVAAETAPPDKDTRNGVALDLRPSIARTLPVVDLAASDPQTGDPGDDSLPHSARTLRFEFAVPSFRSGKQTEYRYQLMGFDEEWSSWSRETRKDYTGLREGRYVFRVGARAGERRLGEAEYRFVIRPPWFRSRGMLVLYVLATLSGLLGVWLWWHRRASLLRRAEAEERARLEALVAERTEELQRVNSELERQAVTDSLTGLHNRRFLRESLPHDLAQMRRSAAAGSVQQGLAFLLVDIDRFKSVNDRYGHVAGDLVLREVGRCLSRARRQGDYLVRWGGDEFLLVTHLGQRSEAAETAQRLHREVGSGSTDLSDFGGVEPLSVSVSIGFSVLPLRQTPDLDAEPQRSLEVADRCLYLVKESGRDGWAGLCACDASLSLGEGEVLRLDPQDARLDLRASRELSATMADRV